MLMPRRRFAVCGVVAALMACVGDEDGMVTGAGSAGSGSSSAGPPPTCQQVYAKATAQCPDAADSLDAYEGECEDDTAELEPTGCAAWESWLRCADATDFSCEDGIFPDCEGHWSGAQQCRAATAATGCVRVASLDANLCAEPNAFAFACFGNPPSSNCMPVETAAAVQHYCCPALR